MSQFQGFGRYRQGEDKTQPFGGANPLFGYAGVEEDALGIGLGVLNSQNLNVLQGTAQLGGWGTEGGGTQVGGRGQASLFEMGGTLGDIAGLFGADVTDSRQGGWENFFSIEGHGPKANAEASVGTDGLQVGAGAELLGASGKLGGAEYDWFGGTEISVGGGFGGVGASGGLHWSDDDQDGIREFGLNAGGKWGLGVDLGVKTELLGHAANGIGAAWDWMTGD